MSRLALITSNQRRHRWVASRLAAAGELVAVVSESKPAALDMQSGSSIDPVQQHFLDREGREAFWFADAPDELELLHAPIRRIPWGESSSPEIEHFLQASEADVVLLFGCSIIKEPLLQLYKGRIINMHLGLSPYYRGSSTNFWPLVDDCPECVGVTIHHASNKVDGGNILLQARPDVGNEDTNHDLGCKSIIAGTRLFITIIQHGMPIPAGIPQTSSGRLCRRNDFSLEHLIKMQENFKSGMLTRYLSQKDTRDEQFPIIVELI